MSQDIAYRTIACVVDTDGFRKALKNLVEQKLIDIKYWVGRKSQFKLVNSYFPGVISHDVIDAIKGRPANIPELNLAVLEKAYINQLLECQIQALEMMNRQDPSNLFSFNERTTLYYEMLQYWTGVINYIKPDLILFPEAPHGVFDFILYKIARLKKIKTRMTDYFECGDAYFYITNSYEDEPPVAKEYKKQLSLNPTITLSPEMSTYINKIQKGSYLDAVPFYDKHLHVNVQAKRYKWMPKYIRKPLLKVRKLYHLMLGASQKAPLNYLKSKSSTMQNAHYSGLQFLLHKYKSNKYKKSLSKYYEKLCTTPDFSKPYIYVALHYQPEMSTSPKGGVFTHQMLMIDWLSRTIPDDWVLYIKEHPWQFSTISKGEQHHARNALYDQIISVPNAHWISLNYKSFDLIDQAIATVTITGKVGLESILRGVPALTFGHVTYAGCEGVFSIQSKKDILEFINIFKKGYKIDQDKINLFFQVIDRVCSKGYTLDMFNKISSISESENVQSIQDAISRSLELKDTFYHIAPKGMGCKSII